MTVSKKQRRGMIISMFRKPGRSSSAVLNKVIEAASREIQVSRIRALLATGLTPREVHTKLKKEFPKNKMSVHSVIYYRRKQLSSSNGPVGRPSKLSVSRKIIFLRDRGIKLSASGKQLR